jgi:hypothetical protein
VHGIGVRRNDSRVGAKQLLAGESAPVTAFQ